MRVIVGFEEKEARAQIREGLKKKGLQPDMRCIVAKKAIVDFLENHKHEGNVVVLLENIPEPYTEEELGRLVDADEDVSVVILLDESRKGTPYMRKLYAAGIYGGIFLAAGEGINPLSLVERILVKRSRPECRKYYGIEEEPYAVDVLDAKKLQELLRLLKEERRLGKDLGERFVSIVGRLTVQESVDFIRKLPNDVRTDMELYDEYWDVLEAIEKQGIPMEWKRPKKLLQGLYGHEKRSMSDGKRNGMENKNMSNMNLNALCAKIERPDTVPKADLQVSMYKYENASNIPLLRNGAMAPSQELPLYREQPRSSLFQQSPYAGMGASQPQTEQAYLFNRQMLPGETAQGTTVPPISRYSYTQEDVKAEPKGKKKGFYIIAGIASLAAVALLSTTIVMWVQMKKTPEEKVSETVQVETESVDVEEQLQEMYAHENTPAESEVYTEPVEELTPVMKEDFAVSEPSMEVDITTLICDGVVLNQLAVDNIMSVYKDQYNFVVYAIPDEEKPSSVESSEETDGEVTEPITVEEEQDRYYKVAILDGGTKYEFREILF